jgi:hypothetical protein
MTPATSIDKKTAELWAIAALDASTAKRAGCERLALAYVN